MSSNYLQDCTLDEMSIDQLPVFMRQHDLQRQYAAQDLVYKFDVLSDKWQLNLKEATDLSFLRELKMPIQTYLALRIALAMRAESQKPKTVYNSVRMIQHIGDGWQDELSFQKAYHLLSANNKNKAKSFFGSVAEDQVSEAEILKSQFEPIINFLNAQSYIQYNSLKGIFDPEKGVYTDEEENEIQEKLRIRIGQLLQSLNKDVAPQPYKLNELGDVIGLTLLKTIHRRPIQLSWIKWVDLLPVGVSFKDHRYAKQSPAPDKEIDFTDIERLHLRTFRAKSGYGFRESAEVRSHRLEPELSKLLAIYKYFYKSCLANHLNQQGVVLGSDEEEDLISRCPLLPEVNLFRQKYENKKNLFATLGYQSNAMHRDHKVITFRLKKESKNLQLTSSRIQQFNISNNRSRHSVITRAVEQGYSPEQVAAITGVTTDAIAAYMNLDMTGRNEINEAMARVKIFAQYGKLGIDELTKLDGFIVKNEFDEVQGMIKRTDNCHTCLSKLCKPLGCYGCVNFRPYLEADHQENLRRIEDKITFNDGADQQVLKKLYNSRIYVRAVITLIHERKVSERGLPHAD